MKEAIGVALIGRKFMGRAHSDALRQVAAFCDPPLVPCLEIVAARESEGLEEFARTWGWERWTTYSPGRGRVDFESLIRLLNLTGYEGPLTVEWEDPMMDREAGATEAAAFTRSLDFPASRIAFDSAFRE